MQRLFSSFPGGWPGVALLLLRIAVGALSLAQGALQLADREHPGVWSGLAGFLALAGGASLLLGLLTPIGGGVVALGTGATALSLLPLPTSTLFDSGLFTAFVAIVAVSIVILGPGALSIDAVLFGRREIVIPHSSRP
ncbi:MAG: hypothetical protein H7039_14945 [Bryobacteraceae bacterium]|nr:hypothetical protein [Bryobacteraceae bacterium]